MRTRCAFLLINGSEEDFKNFIGVPGLRGVVPPPVSEHRLERVIDAVQRGELCFSRGLMSRQMQALRERGGLDKPATALTIREWHVLRLIAEGHSNATIASLLHLSLHTVRSHGQKIFRKIGANNRTQAALWACQQGHPGDITVAEKCNGVSPHA